MKREEILGVLAAFRERRRDEYGIARIGIFGSAARDDMHGSSDVDVVVFLDQPDLFTIIGIKQELEELLRVPVDVIRFRDRMNLLLKKRIEREAVYV